MAYHVKRGEFDELLLRHSEEAGAIVREETEIREVLFEGPRAVGVVARGRNGQDERIRARVVVDASGRPRFSRRLGTRRLDSNKRAASLRALRGSPRPAGKQAGGHPAAGRRGRLVLDHSFLRRHRERGRRLRSRDRGRRRRRDARAALRSPHCSQRKDDRAPLRRPANLEGPRHLGLLRGLGEAPRRRLCPRRRRRDVPRSRVFDRRLPRHGDGPSRRARHRPGDCAPRPRGCAGS